MDRYREYFDVQYYRRHYLELFSRPAGPMNVIVAFPVLFACFVPTVVLLW